jgi:hypothetical protein
MRVFVVSMVVWAALAGPAAAQRDMKRAEACRSKLKEAHDVGVITDVSLQPTEIRLVVDLKTWQSVDFSTKTGMVEAVVCLFTVGDTTKTAKINVYDNMNNKLVGQYDGRTLIVR